MGRWDAFGNVQTPRSQGVRRARAPSRTQGPAGGLLGVAKDALPKGVLASPTGEAGLRLDPARRL